MLASRESIQRYLNGPRLDDVIRTLNFHHKNGTLLVSLSNKSDK
jgi:hypothetical protein